jgi:hypothetical protein
MNRSSAGLKKTTKKSQNSTPKTANNKNVLKTQRRSIVSYRAQPKDLASQRRSAKRQMKNQDKQHTVSWKPQELKLSGPITETLPNGTSVQFLAGPDGKQLFDTSSPQRRFGPLASRKHARSHLRVETAPEFIHKIATTVAQTKPIAVVESSLKDINNEYISNTKNFTVEDYKANSRTNHIVRLSPPSFMKAGVFNRRSFAASVNQRNRWNALIQQRSLDITRRRQEFAAEVKKISEYVPFDSGFSSSQDVPIDFSKDLTLKFRVIDAVIKATKIQVPSSQLAKIHNVNDLVEFVVSKRVELMERSGVRKSQERLPENVTYIYTGKIDRSKKPKWEQWATNREKKSVVSADV